MNPCSILFIGKSSTTEPQGGANHMQKELEKKKKALKTKSELNSGTKHWLYKPRHLHQYASFHYTKSVKLKPLLN